MDKGITIHTDDYREVVEEASMVLVVSKDVPDELLKEIAEILNGMDIPIFIDTDADIETIKLKKDVKEVENKAGI